MISIPEMMCELQGMIPTISNVFNFVAHEPNARFNFSVDPVLVKDPCYGSFHDRGKFCLLNTET